MKRDRYWVERVNFLMSDRHGEILTGPQPDLELFARWLNLDPPQSVPDLQDRLMQLIMVSRGGSFCIKPGLRAAEEDSAL